MQWHFHSTSNEVIWPKKNLNSMHGTKSAILVICKKGQGPRWPCPECPALKNPSQDFKNSFCFRFLKVPRKGKIRETPFFKVQFGKIPVCVCTYNEKVELYYIFCCWLVFCFLMSEDNRKVKNKLQFLTYQKVKRKEK
jgi:hypothetical protein